MKQILIRLREDQLLFLKSLPGTVAEHIRTAIDDYISKQRDKADVATSLSKKGGDNGRK